MTTQQKSFTPSFKAVGDDGTAVFVVATLNVIDKDGDVTLPGFFGEQDVVVLPAHDRHHVPLGKGTIREAGEDVIAAVKFNLDIPAARDWHSAIKFDFENPPSLQEYSYGFSVLKGGAKSGTFQGQRVQILQPLDDGSRGVDVHEVSPVLRGAGVGTRTLAAKATGTFAQHSAEVLQGVSVLLDRAEEIKTLRAATGNGLGQDTKTALRQLDDDLKRLHALIGNEDAAVAEYLIMVKNRWGV